MWYSVALFTISCCLWMWRQLRSKLKEPPFYTRAYSRINLPRLVTGDSTQLWTLIKDVSSYTVKAGGVIAANIGPKTVYGNVDLRNVSKIIYWWYDSVKSQPGLSQSMLKKLLVITDPDVFSTICNKSLRKSGVYDFAKPWLGESLVIGDPAIWKIHRKLINPAFSQQVLDGYIGIFNKQARSFVKNIAVEVGKGPFDQSKYVHQHTLESICATAIGVNFNDETMSNEYFIATSKMFDLVMKRFQRFWLHVDLIFKYSSLKKEQDKYIRIMHRVVDKVLAKKKAEYLRNKSGGCTKPAPKLKSFMDLLLELSIEKGALNDQEIKEEVNSMIVAGEDTVAGVLVFIMVLVGSHDAVQRRIFDEITSMFGDTDRDVSKLDLARLVYLDAVIKESLRLYPIAFTIARRLDEDIQLPQYTLYGGRTCFLSIYGIHRHPVWGPDADKFNPERWLHPASLPKNENAFVAFSTGKRICIGKAYAFMLLKTTLVHLLRQYTLKGDHTKMVLKPDILLKPVSGHYISINRRNMGSTSRPSL